MAPAGTFLVAVAVSSAAAFGITNAVGTGGEPAPAIEEEGKFPATPRVVVDSGTIPGVGDYHPTSAVGGHTDGLVGA